ncbi:MAG: Stp1/IreP family PP2C-type Ser/Thr phosphatase [Nitrospinae bacterium]|nr:Stp1/IreP family PP2C-type Ser/Thr phosphatase [Nitrospinota bacterium]
MKLVGLGKTDTGMKRKINQDAIACREDLGLFVVADGMGGHKAGEIASGIVIDSMTRFIKATKEDQNITWPFPYDDKYSYEGNRLGVSIKIANQLIFHESKAEESFKGMGSTVAAILFSEATSHFAHVGDSRIYRIRDGAITQMTEDHSLLNAEMKRRKMTPEEIHSFPYKNVITRALGSQEKVDVEIREEIVRPRDLYLICSDGLSGLVDAEEMKDIFIQSPEDLESVGTRLVDLANERGGIDNISVVLVTTQAPGKWKTS